MFLPGHKGLAPSIFNAQDGQSAVFHQPETNQQLLRGLQAAAACPTGSIRTESPFRESKNAISSFPIPAVDNDDKVVPNVFYNGFTSQESFACSSWLLQSGTPEDPFFVMFDCPRFFQPLAKSIEKLTASAGGVRYIVLSHRDDVAWHQEWADRLNAKRVIHAVECNSRQGTDKCEIKLQLSDDNDRFELAPGLELLHVPGHSKGSIALLDSHSRSLFTGDHVAYVPSRERISGFPNFLSHSWQVQIASVAKLAKEPFIHAWPGHGRAFHFRNDAERETAIGEAVTYMKTLKARLP